MSAEQYAQEIEADFVTFVGRVFAEFDEAAHVTDLAYDPSRPVYLATDTGFRAPYVVLFIQVGPWDDVRVLDEYYQTGRTVSEVAEAVQANPLARGVTALYPEPASPADAASLSDVLRIRKVASATGGALDRRLELIRRALKFGPEHVPFDQQTAHLYIDRRCRNLIREMQDYRYPETSDGRTPSEKPLDKDDHSPEALGRFFAGHFGHTLEDSRARIRKAAMR